MVWVGQRGMGRILQATATLLAPNSQANGRENLLDYTYAFLSLSDPLRIGLDIQVYLWKSHVDFWNLSGKAIYFSLEASSSLLCGFTAPQGIFAILLVFPMTSGCTASAANFELIAPRCT